MTENPKDPLRQAPDAEAELFRAMTRMCAGFSHEQVAGAALNLLVNVLRQSNATRKGAFDATDRVHSSLRKVLDAHYDNSGRRRNIFPFHQVIEVPKIDPYKKE